MNFIPLQYADLTPGGFYTIAPQNVLTPDGRRLRPGQEESHSGAMKYVKSTRDGVTLSYYDSSLSRKWIDSFFRFSDGYSVAEVSPPADQVPTSVSYQRGSLGTQSSYFGGKKKRRTTNSSRAQKRSKTRKYRRATGGGR